MQFSHPDFKKDAKENPNLHENFSAPKKDLDAMPTLKYDSSIQERVQLPSLGIHYDGLIPNGFLDIRAMTTKEEKLLYGGAGNVSEKLKQIVSRCCSLPQGILVDDLLVSDQFFLMIKIRILSLGAEYPVIIKCPNCRESYQDTIKLSQMNVRMLSPNSQKEPFIVTLPRCKQKLGFRLLRVRDEEAIYNFRRQKNRASDDDTLLYSFARRIVSLDGKQVDQISAMLLMEQMIPEDRNEFEIACGECDSGIDTTLRIECKKCAFLLDSEVELTEEFFRPKRRKV